MTILLAGSNGYLGNVLFPILERYRNTVGIDLCIFEPRYRCDWVDISVDPYSHMFDSVVKDYDTVVHLAGISNDPSSELNPQLTERMNIDASKRLIDFASAQGVTKFIFASSASVYGANDALVDETSLPNPQSLYAKSKLEIENYLLEHKNLNPVIFRFGTLFGVSPKMRFDLAVNLMTKDAILKDEVVIFGNGAQYRPFLHVRDAATAVATACTSGMQAGIYNLAHSSIRIKSLAEIVSSKTGANINYLSVDHPDTRNYKMNCEKIKDFLPPDSLPARSIVFGVDEVAEWVKANDTTNVDYYTIEAWKRWLK